MVELLTDAEKAAFRRDGAVHLKGQFGAEWIEKLRAGIEADIGPPTAYFARHTKDPKAPA